MKTLATLTALTSLSLLVFTVQINGAEHCAKRTVAGLLHHQTFFSVEPHDPASDLKGGIY